MKAIAVLSGLLVSVLAAPTTPALDTRTLIPKGKCPANAFQPNGKLPTGSISTSLLVPISSKNPNKAYPATQWATVTPNDMCTIFNLVLDSDAVQGKVCSLVFDFPGLLQAPGLFAFFGSGKFTFTGYAINSGAVAGQTTYNKQPSPGPSPPFPPPALKPGNSYVINSAPCGIPPGIGKVTVSGALCSKDTTLIFKQSNQICPLGFYVVLTDAP
ncbi:ubiquitin 3 binding protein But2 C-terminal domain-containing protein, partial [Pyrenochaeta sp. MPI-SDFR-AT-0127]